MKPRTVRGKIVANSALILGLLGAATLYSGFASFELTESVEALFRNNLSVEQIQNSLDQTESNLSAYLRTKSSDSLKDFIRTSTVLSEQTRALAKDIVDDPIILVQRDLSRVLDTYLQTAEAGIEAKRARDIPGYAGSFERSGIQAGYARLLITDLKSRFLTRSLEAFTSYRNMIPWVLWSSAAMVVSATLLGFTLLLGYARKLTDPLSRLAEAASAVGRGNYETVVPSPADAQDEIGTLSWTFIRMQENLRHYFQNLQTENEAQKGLLEEKMRVLELNHRLKDAELLALQTQINPHFLFNTLTAGIGLAGAESAVRTEVFLENLAAFIRYALVPPDRFVLVADELKCVNRYTWLMKLRFGDRYQFEVEVDDRVLGVEVPALILQPLVENALSHGLADRESGGRIKIRGVLSENKVILSVWDNGVGMDPGEMGAVLAETVETEKTGSHGIGLRNVIRRIRLSSNGRGDVELETGQGFLVRIILPLLTEGEPT